MTITVLVVEVDEETWPNANRWRHIDAFKRHFNADRVVDLRDEVELITDSCLVITGSHADAAFLQANRGASVIEFSRQTASEIKRLAYRDASLEGGAA
jgi:hypothetical protein